MYLGADLSYVNEIEDSGGVFHDQGRASDPFAILQRHGANIARARLWHTPTWTAYSHLADVKRTLRRARDLDMALLLDFHYSDTWADPAKQIIPAAWSHITDTDALEQAIFEYTLETLRELEREALMPEFVQVGNEINTEILMPAPHDGRPINWPRNAPLINAALRAVRQAGQPRVMLHIAQPENIAPWFDAALAAGVDDFDLIGMSYYPKWSACSIRQAGQTVGEARARYGRDVMVVETAYPWTLSAGRAASHLLAEDSVLPAYPATPQGQRAFLVDLTQSVYDSGGIGVVYWEAAWISTPQKPSIWENATLFDYEGRVHEGIKFLSHAYPVRAQE